MLTIKLPNLVPVQAPVPAQASVQTPPSPVQTPPAKPQRTRVQAPVSDPAPVVVNTPPVVVAPLVAVVNTPAGVQQLVGQVQDLIIQHVAIQIVVPETPMEVEDEDAILERLFFKRFGRALPEKEKESDVDKINFVIDLTDESDEMEVATPVVVVKSEPIEAPEIVENVTNVNNKYDVYNESGIRVSRRLELIELAKARKAITEFGKSLRKKEVIIEKEAPLAAGTSAIADTDTNMSEDVPVSIEEAERAMAESEAEIAATQKVIDEFDD
jgi:hypothetical protein